MEAGIRLVTEIQLSTPVTETRGQQTDLPLQWQPFIFNFLRARLAQSS